MIKNIIFDMGNVLIYFNREIFLDRVGVTDPEDRKLLLREVYLSLEWSRMDRGSLSDEEAADIIARRVPERLRRQVHQLVNEWDRPILPVPGMEDLVRELRVNGYGIYLLSNASFRQHVYWPRVPAADLFYGTLISADVHLVKPQPEIYELLCNTFSLKKEECVFIDDSTPNVEGAFFTGMPAIVFHDDVCELRRKLRELGIQCCP
ncbi:MAG: HAD family phosphatase [Oscillospiraceae bacterium]|nr:HAD family phosphatase [Oscillospiraceae bacterium]